MWRQFSAASILLLGVAVAGFALVSHRAGRSDFPVGKTISPAAASRQWLQAHGYLDETGRPVPHPQPGS